MGDYIENGFLYLEFPVNSGGNALSIVSSPLQTFPLEGFFFKKSGDFNDFHASFLFDYNNVTQIFFSHTLTDQPLPGKGYFTGSASDSEFSILLVGTPCTENIDIPVSTGTDNFNLVGNPYTTTLDFASFAANPNNLANTTGTIYLWNDVRSNQNGSNLRAGDYVAVTSMGKTRKSPSNVTGNNAIDVQNPTSFNGIVIGIFCRSN